MKVLVAYASAYGSAKGVAGAIGDRLAGVGLDVEVRSVDEVTALTDHDVVVLGSAIHNSAWLPPARRFVDAHVSELAERRVWVFAVSSIGETSSFFGPRVARVGRRARRRAEGSAPPWEPLHPEGHRSFAGVIEHDHWNRVGRLFMRVFGGRYGDHRDWDDIRSWADEIARCVQAVDTAAPSGGDRPFPAGTPPS
jgi:menaquinone-dependent protoporphyrinogen oxidase